MTTVFPARGDLEAALGTTLGPTPWFPIRQDHIDAFAEATGDHQWIHVDPGRAADGPYGRTIAHGYLTLSLIPRFGGELFRFDFGGARVNYGLDKVRFPSPVPVDAQVRASAQFLELRPVAAGTQLRTRYTIESDTGGKPACVAETLTLLLP
ncbi:MaoC family dehydratase [Amycolatopsis acidicola]|uniref:MaoC family dehydratase n=1 Tax=Amycolatopsis acidicola TaxID=2596893 RepID=A0A5N0VEH4_9PSEU|nr:MaoC family dehydratase [Amycolatopsis acidicola]KAA9163241.1 MaoC family dehydratase [Amycolatopsis acidicola]